MTHAASCWSGRTELILVVCALATLTGIISPARADNGVGPIRLVAGESYPGQTMPHASIEMPPAGTVYLVQANRPWGDATRAFVSGTGCDLLAYVPEETWLVRCPLRAAIDTLRKAPFVARIEPFHCSYRLAPEVESWISGEAGPEEEPRALNALAFGPAAKRALAAEARVLGAWPGPDDGDGSVLRLRATRSQARRLACDDHLAWLAPTSPIIMLMDNVRADSGADWQARPENGGRCGAGVRGEILDAGLDLDHREYADRLTLHGPVGGESWHGTATFGIAFSSGNYDAKSKGMLPCGDGIAGDFNAMTDRFSFTKDTKNVHHASFQSNSWGNLTYTYDVPSFDMDEIAWRLDFALLQAAGNSGDLSWPNIISEGMSKNAIVVGGFNHADTLTLADDWFCGHDCTVYTSQSACEADIFCAWPSGACANDYICASYGPTNDGRQKPDLSYWVDHIYTTDTDPATGADGYRAAMYGTSSASPMTAGVLGLILEMWADTSQGGVNPWGKSPAGSTVFEKQPHASTMKALLANSAEQYAFSGTSHVFTRARQGWGRANAESAKRRAAHSLVVDEETVLREGESATWTLVVEPGEPELRATLSWLDPPKNLLAAGKQLLDDLDLKLVSPPDDLGNVSVYCGNAGLNGSMYSAPLWTGAGPASAAPDCDTPVIAPSRNGLDNLEGVIVHEASPGEGIRAGTWTIKVKAFDVNVDQSTNTTCRNINLDPYNPNAGRTACQAAGCVWNSTYGVCGDSTVNVRFGLVVTGSGAAPEASAGESAGLQATRGTGGERNPSWETDCGAGTTYGVYRGNLLAGYSSIAPESGKCALTGTTTTVPAGAGTSDFFLVVPQAASKEGSYGVNSSAQRRPPATSPCAPQGSIDACAP